MWQLDEQRKKKRPAAAMAVAIRRFSSSRSSNSSSSKRNKRKARWEEEEEEEGDEVRRSNKVKNRSSSSYKGKGVERAAEGIFLFDNRKATASYSGGEACNCVEGPVTEEMKHKWKRSWERELRWLQLREQAARQDSWKLKISSHSDKNTSD